MLNLRWTQKNFEYPVTKCKDMCNKYVYIQVEDSTVEIETLRQQLGALEKRQKTLEQNLREEKATSERLAMERDNAERESRQKETTIINLTLELDELRDHLEKVELLRITQACELDSTQLTLDVCKSVSVN
ncbi:hypothetical protein LSAT2_031711 [Lamellibrachia satsuma]|nr:hypothetical protein LSAT2_031711 [Lamellibrachia satsuma]